MGKCAEKYNIFWSSSLQKTSYKTAYFQLVLAPNKNPVVLVSFFQLGATLKVPYPIFSEGQLSKIPIF